MQWVDKAETILFMGTSNSVGFTYNALFAALNSGKNVVVVDPNPSPNFDVADVEILSMESTAFCMEFLL